MSTTEELESAEAKMNGAKDALMTFIESGKAIDRERHRRLLARLNKTQADFLKAVSESGK